MPGRALLAARLRKGSRDTVDRALKELVAASAAAVEHPSGPEAKPGRRRRLLTRSPKHRGAEHDPEDGQRQHLGALECDVGEVLAGRG